MRRLPLRPPQHRPQLVGRIVQGRKTACVDGFSGPIIGLLSVVTEAGFLMGLRLELEAQTEQRAGPTHSRPAGPAQAR